MTTDDPLSAARAEHRATHPPDPDRPDSPEEIRARLADQASDREAEIRAAVAREADTLGPVAADMTWLLGALDAARERADRAEAERDHYADLLTTPPDVAGRCPACARPSLMLTDGHVVCRRTDCPNPIAVDDLLSGVRPGIPLAEFTARARRRAEHAGAERDRLAALVSAATRYAYSDLPEDDPDRETWTVTAEYRDRSYPGLRRRWLTRHRFAAWLEWQADLAALAAELADKETS